ncbi:MAG: helix-turn-helix domain-containing protein [Deltaproteobacteria bacterium]|nr:helix-turn-helix domain-containing protein [Deltaproteobacteria bacterium]
MRAGEVRQMLGIGKNTLYEWCRQGIIPHKRIGRLIFFSRRVIQDFLENKMEGGMK